MSLLRRLLDSNRNWIWLFVMACSVTFIAAGSGFIYAANKVSGQLHINDLDKVSYGADIPTIGLNFNQTSLTTTTLLANSRDYGQEVGYKCPECPTLQECPEITTTVNTQITTTYPTMTLPPEAEYTPIQKYTIKPDHIDFRWQTCDPRENVSYPTENILTYTNETYNMTYLNGTSVILNKSSEVKMTTIKGGCIVVPTSCCRCKDGGNVDTINAKYYRRYYSEVLNNCSGDVICPMILRSPIGCNPVARCLDGRCVIVNR